LTFFPNIAILTVPDLHNFLQLQQQVQSETTYQVYASPTVFHSLPLPTHGLLQPPFSHSDAFFNFTVAKICLASSNCLFQLPLSLVWIFRALHRLLSLRGKFVFNYFTLPPMRPRQSRWQKPSEGKQHQIEITTPKPKLKFASTPIGNFPNNVLAKHLLTEECGVYRDVSRPTG